MTGVPQRFGIEPVTAAEQLARSWPPKAPVQPLPAGTAGRVAPAALGIKPATVRRFCVIGDHGGVKDPTLQNYVTAAMEAIDPPDFVYSVGDVVYFNGDASEYGPQFYEAYAHLAVPILAIPGNHDGDTTDDPSRQPLDTFMANFCSTTPTIPAGQEEYNRETQVQPYCDWTLAAETFTLIGLYSNVPSGGHLEDSQTAFLASELSAADPGKPVIVALHHPPYSIDAHHGGSAKMLTALDGAFEASKRCADMVLSGHVHDYQRFTRTYWGREIAYVVIGNSGYHNLHQLAPGATAGQPIDGADPDVVFEYGDDSHGGFLTVTCDGQSIKLAYNQVDRDTGSSTPNLDHCTISEGKIS